MNWWKTAVFFGCILLLQTVTPAQTEVAAKMTQLVGKVEVRTKGAATWRPGRIGMPVKEGSDVRSFVESEAEVTFENGTQVKVGENSVVTLARLQKDPATNGTQSTVKVMSGKVWGNVKKLTGKQSEFDFETPTAVASIRGTRLGIDVGKKHTLIDVYEGLVVVRRRDGHATVNVSANSRAVIDPAQKTIAVIDFKKIEASADGKSSDTPPADPYAGAAKQPVETEKGSDTTKAKQPDQDTLPGKGPPPAVQEPAPADTIPAAAPRGPAMGVPKREERDDEAVATRQRLTLTITSPPEGARITEPLLQIAGNTTAGAKVFVNDVQATVGRDGSFSARIPLPDEPSSYSVEVRAELGGTETVRQRSVVYEPHVEKLILECTSPTNGQVITGRSIRIAGKTAPRATVTANNIPLSVSASGVFTGEIPVTEQNIGDFQLEVAARNQDDELSRTFSLDISASSPQINTSVPVLVFSMQGQSATTQRTLPVQVLDRTRDDELTIKITNNGSSDNIATEPGRTEQLLLNEGENNYQISVVDRAGNSSPVIKGKLYYLPGPVVLLLREPSSNPMVYEGLPPALHPGSKIAEEPVDVEVEIDDGIGNVPQSIRFCRVTGNGQTVLLRNNNDYIYRGKVNVRRGSNSFTLQAEDLTGRLETLRFEVVVR